MNTHTQTGQFLFVKQSTSLTRKNVNFELITLLTTGALKIFLAKTPVKRKCCQNVSTLQEPPCQSLLTERKTCSEQISPDQEPQEIADREENKRMNMVHKTICSHSDALI